MFVSCKQATKRITRCARAGVCGETNCFVYKEQIQEVQREWKGKNSAVRCRRGGAAARERAAVVNGSVIIVGDRGSF